MMIRFYCVAQDSQIKIVADSKTKKPIEFVNIYSEDKKTSLSGDSKGKFTINFSLDL